MSASCESVTNTMQCCASCGIAEVDDIKLKDCGGCDLVRYCSDECQKDHRSEHEEECKKRAAELRDEILFKQPESNHYGDCPICCLPLPLDPQKSSLNTCCCKLICKGCDYANGKREIKGRLQEKCPFCRTAVADTDEEDNEQTMKRVEANDPVAICYMGTERCQEGDYKSAFEYWSKAAALGDVVAHYQLSILYGEGKGGFEKDKKMELYHTEQAAIGGNPEARNNLACLEGKNGQYDRAAKHWIIAAKQGYDDSLSGLKGMYKAEMISKDNFTDALRGYQTAIAATKSPQREEAYAFFGI